MGWNHDELSWITFVSLRTLRWIVDAIESVIADLDRKTERAHSEYDTRENEHNSEVTRING